MWSALAAAAPHHAANKAFRVLGLARVTELEEEERARRTGVVDRSGGGSDGGGGLYSGRLSDDKFCLCDREDEREQTSLQAVWSIVWVTMETTDLP